MYLGQTRCSHFLPENVETICAGGNAKFGVADVYDAKVSAPIMLNIHAVSSSGDGQLEVARLVPHLSNGAFIVSERSLDPQLDDSFDGLLAFVPKSKTSVRVCCCSPGAVARRVVRCGAVPDAGVVGGACVLTCHS